MAQRNIIVVGSAHKVGSTWLYELLGDALELQRGLPPPHLDDGGGTLLLEHPDAAGYLAGLSGNQIFKAHSFADPRGFSDTRFISIHRDPRDVVVSTAFYLSWLPVEQGGKGTEFSGLPVNERIKTIIHSEYFLEKLEEWFYSSAYQVRYEDLLDDAPQALGPVFQHLALQPSPQALAAAIARNSFKAKSGRPIGAEDPASFYRKGAAGDWRNHFDRLAAQEFKTALDGQWNALLLAMKYELSADWQI